MQHIPSITLHIEELVLHGFAREDRSAIGEALQNELQRLFSEQGLPPSLQEDGSLHLAQLQAEPIVVQPGTRVESIGTELARSLYVGLKRDDSENRGLHPSKKGLANR